MITTADEVLPPDEERCPSQNRDTGKRCARRSGHGQLHRFGLTKWDTSGSLLAEALERGEASSSGRGLITSVAFEDGTVWRPCPLTAGHWQRDGHHGCHTWAEVTGEPEEVAESSLTVDHLAEALGHTTPAGQAVTGSAAWLQRELGRVTRERDELRAAMTELAPATPTVDVLERIALAVEQIADRDNRAEGLPDLLRRRVRDWVPLRLAGADSVSWSPVDGCTCPPGEHVAVLP